MQWFRKLDSVCVRVQAYEGCESGGGGADEVHDGLCGERAQTLTLVVRGVWASEPRTVALLTVINSMAGVRYTRTRLPRQNGNDAVEFRCITMQA